MATQIKAIETHYKGYRFRSRLEARWAVFFDCFSVKWEYEPDGFKMPSGECYLPDFRVTISDGRVIWFEVKPSGSGLDPKFSEFLREIDSPISDVNRGFQLSGEPYDVIKDDEFCPRCGAIGKPAYGLTVHSDGEFFFGCQDCDFTTPGGGGHPYAQGVTVMVAPHKGFIIGHHWNDHRYIVNYARISARSARFEHGERGAK